MGVQPAATPVVEARPKRAVVEARSEAGMSYFESPAKHERPVKRARRAPVRVSPVAVPELSEYERTVRLPMCVKRLIFVV